MSRTFSTNSGSLESFQCSTRCGWSPNVRQILETAVWLSPLAAAILRVDQCVPASGGRSSKVLTITCSTCSSVILLRLPRSRLIQQSVKTTLDEALAPLADHLRRHPLTRRHRLVGEAL